MIRQLGRIHRRRDDLHSPSFAERPDVSPLSGTYDETRGETANAICMSQASEEVTGAQATSADLLKQVVDLLLEVSKPRKIILFGSYARGTQTEDSDLDLVVVLERFESRHREIVRLRRALDPIEMPIDVLVYSEKEVEERGNWLGSALPPGPY